MDKQMVLISVDDLRTIIHEDRRQFLQEVASIRTAEAPKWVQGNKGLARLLPCSLSTARRISVDPKYASAKCKGIRGIEWNIERVRQIRQQL